MVYMLVYIIFSIPAADYTDRSSLRNGLILGSVLNTVGALVRVLPYPFLKPASGDSSSMQIAFACAFIGQTLTACKQLIFSLPLLYPLESYLLF